MTTSNLTFTAKEVSALLELVYAITEDEADLQYPPGIYATDGQTAVASKKMRKHLGTAWTKLAEADRSDLDWDDLFDGKAPCSECGK